MRKFLSMTLLLLGGLTAPAQADDNKPPVFDAMKLVGVMGNLLIFNDDGIKIVPFADLETTSNGGLIAMRGLAETSSFQKVLGRSVTVFTLSGNGAHWQSFDAIANAVANLIEGNVSAIGPPAVLRAKWVTADHITIEVEISRNPGESSRDHNRRFVEAVNDTKRDFEPVKGG